MSDARPEKVCKSATSDIETCSIGRLLNDPLSPTREHSEMAPARGEDERRGREEKERHPRNEVDLCVILEKVNWLSVSLSYAIFKWCIMLGTSFHRPSPSFQSLLVWPNV